MNQIFIKSYRALHRFSSLNVRFPTKIKCISESFQKNHLCSGIKKKSNVHNQDNLTKAITSTDVISAPIADEEELLKLKIKEVEQDVKKISKKIDLKEKEGKNTDKLEDKVNLLLQRLNLLSAQASASTQSTASFSTSDVNIVIDSLLKKAFNYEPHSAYLFQNDSYVNGSLFSSHIKDMSSELIGFKLPAAIQIIDENLRIPRSSGNAKPIIGTVRGIGGGKTRMLEEFRQHYLREEDVLIISVTFNSNWKPESCEKTRNDSPEVCLALSLLARMASVLYNKNLKEILANFSKVDLYSLAAEDVELLFRRCIQYVVNQVGKKRKVRKFILSIDESVRMEDFLKKDDNKSDMYAPIRKALLELDFGVLEGLETALIMSTLEPSPLGETESGRGIADLPATVLTGEEIVSKWWKVVDATSEEKLKLIAFATALSTIPRLVEFGCDFLQTQVDKTGKLMSKIDDCFFGSMLECIQIQITQRFGKGLTPIPSIELLYDIIYGRPITVKEAIPLVRQNIVINDISGCKKMLQNPKLAMLILERSLQCSKFDAVPVSQSIENIIKAVKSIGKFKGYSLEVFFREWFSIRTYLALRNPQNELTTGTLLGLDSADIKLFQADTANILNSEIKIPKMLNFNCIQTLEEGLYNDPPSSDSVEKFYNSIMNKKPYENNPVVLLECVEGDHQDFVLMVYSGDVGNPHIYGLDAKAREEITSSKSTENKISSNFPGDNHMKWKDFCIKYSLPYSFIYISTHDRNSFDRDGVVVLRRSIISKFFVSIWETYLATRNVDDNVGKKKMKT